MLVLMPTEGRAGIEGVEPDEGVVFKMDGRQPFGQRLAQHLAGARPSGGDGPLLRAVLFLLTQRLFQR